MSRDLLAVLFLMQLMRHNAASWAAQCSAHVHQHLQVRFYQVAFPLPFWCLRLFLNVVGLRISLWTWRNSQWLVSPACGGPSECHYRWIWCSNFSSKFPVIWKCAEGALSIIEQMLNSPGPAPVFTWVYVWWVTSLQMDVVQLIRALWHWTLQVFCLSLCLFI